MTPIEELLLLQRVFKSDDGAAVLQIFKRMYKDKRLYNQDTNAVYYSLGVADFIQFIEDQLKLDPNIISNVRSFNPFNN